MLPDIRKRLAQSTIYPVTGEPLVPGSRADISVEDASEAYAEIGKLRAEKMQLIIAMRMSDIDEIETRKQIGFELAEQIFGDVTAD